MPRQHPTTLRTRAAALALLAAATLATSACNQQAAGNAGASNATLLTVSAHAEVRRAPDIATLSTGVTKKGTEGMKTS